MAKAVDKLAAVTAVREPKDLNYALDLTMWTYDKSGHKVKKFDFSEQTSDLRVFLTTSQASTVEIDLEDSDYQVLSDPLFANWAFNIDDVSLSSQKKFKVTRLSNSTDTAHYGDSQQLEWVLGQRPIDINIAEVYFRLCAIQAQKTTVTLTFEDRVASLLRDKSGSKSWDRSQHTRAQFVAMLCKEAGVDYWIPEIDVTQPIAPPPSTTSSSSLPANPNGKGLTNTPGLTVLGQPLSPTQVAVAQTLLGECDRLNAPLICWQAILYAGVGETGLGTSAKTYQPNGAYTPYSPKGFWGVLQGAVSTWPDPHDVAGQADAFLQGGKGFQSGGAIALAKSGVVDPAEIAVKVEVPSVWPSNAYEAEWGAAKDAALRNEIDKIVGAYGGPSTTASTSVTSTTGSYAFTRGPNEDSWDCIQRLASEVAWYAFARQNRLWFVSGEYLFSQKPQLTFERGEEGVDDIDVDIDLGARDSIAQCDVYGRSSLWAALPGMTVQVLRRGPATGKWYVTETQGHPLDHSQQTQVTLYKPVPKRPEPYPSSNNASPSSNPGTPSLAAGTPGGAYWAAQQLSNKKLTYTQGARTLKPLNQIKQGETLYDCSASVSWVLLRGGFPLPGQATWGSWAPVSGDFFAGGAGGALLAGEGKYMTIWANSQHMFIEFKIPGTPHSQGNTVNPFGNGFGLFSWNEPRTGGWGGPSPGAGNAPSFTPVHYPGT